LKLKTVVTGGTGFIGSHLVKELLNQGDEVVVVSDMYRQDTSNLSCLGIKPDDIELLKADLSDYSGALKLTAGAGTVFHLAARIGNLEYLHGSKDAELIALQTNLAIDANVLRVCQENGVSKLIYTSSCAVYPLDRQFSSDAVLDEDDLCLDKCQPPNTQAITINPDGGYGLAKLIGEIELMWAKDVKISIARLFNVYGENEPLGKKAHVVADLISKALRCRHGEKFTVNGNGQQSRDFLYVTDCVYALLRLEERAANPPVVVNVGSGEATTIATIAEKVTALSGKDIKIEYDSSKPAGPISRTANMTRARTLLDWQPRVSIDEGLKRTYSWVESRLKAEGLSQ
jgi:nucleoside-diphosphate-sugar epimerase